MLKIKPNCELCDCDLPVDSENAMICSYECTLCVQCVTQVLENVCPNCGGGFSMRPIRPKTAYRKGVSIKHQVASTLRVYTPYSKTQLKVFSDNIKSIPAQLR